MTIPKYQKWFSWKSLLVVTSFLISLLVLGIMFAPNQSAASDKYVWCFDTVTDERGGIHEFGHDPTFVQKPSEYFKGATLQDSQCFANWSDVTAYVTHGEVKLPENATKEDYVRVTEELYARPGSPVLEAMQSK